LNTPGKRALYSNLCKDRSLYNTYDPTTPNPEDDIALKDRALELAQKIDQSVKRVRHADWRGHTARENEIKRALYEVLQDHQAVDGIFPILVQQREY
jgi:type I restriction enzyme R subunit